MRKVVLAIVAALSALLAVPALAADGTLSASTPTYGWEGGPVNGAAPGEPVPFAPARCTSVYQCDNEHIEIKDGGTLTIDIKAGSGSNDLDLRLYKSDAEGSAPGVQNPAAPADPPIAEDIRTEKDAKVVVRNIKPGFYVAQVAAYNAQAGTYTGTATLAPPPPAAPAPGTTAPAPSTTAPTTQTTPSSGQTQADEAKRKKKLKACNKKAKKIKNAKKRKAAQKKCAKKFGKKKA